MSNIQIYLDLDGVMADFVSHTKKIYNIDLKLVNKSANISTQLKKNIESMWSDIKKHPEFWSEIPPILDCFILWDYFKELNPIILTAAPLKYGENSREFKLVAENKFKWVNNFLDLDDKNRFICTTSTKKQFFMKSNHHNILIDDMTKVIANWNNKGGIGILLDVLPVLKRRGFLFYKVVNFII